MTRNTATTPANAASTDTLDHDSTAVPVVGGDTSLEGVLATDADLRFEGRLRGELRCAGRLALGPQSHVHGVVRCGELQLSGTVDGDIVVNGTARIGHGASLTGTLYALMVNFDEGGSYCGRIHMGQSALARAETEVKPPAFPGGADESGSSLDHVEDRLRLRLAELEAAVTELK